MGANLYYEFDKFNSEFWLSFLVAMQIKICGICANYLIFFVIYCVQNIYQKMGIKY